MDQLGCKLKGKKLEAYKDWISTGSEIQAPLLHRLGTP